MQNELQNEGIKIKCMAKGRGLVINCLHNYLSCIWLQAPFRMWQIEDLNSSWNLEQPLQCDPGKNEKDWGWVKVENHLLLIVLLTNPSKEGIETESNMIYPQGEEILCEVAIIQQLNNSIANLVQILLNRLSTCLLP